MILADGIACWDGFQSSAECKNFIDYFESMAELGLTYDRQASQSVESHKIKDRSISCLENFILLYYPCNNLLADFLPKFWQKFSEYSNHYSLLSDYDSLTIRSIKIQKTAPAEGYHVWHTEQMTKQDAQRVCVWTLYLNTVAEGGETEWLYQSKRIQAIAGRLAIWPSSYTHAHRGNPPLSGVKYILTGWVEFN